MSKKYILISKKLYYAGGFSINNNKLIPLVVELESWSKKFKLLSQAERAKQKIKSITGQNFRIKEILKDGN